MDDTKKAKRTRRTTRGAGLILAVVTAGVAVTACASSAPSDPVAAKATCGGSSPRLTVQGSGLSTGTPDLLTVSVGIDVTDPTATEAIADDNSRATAVTGVLGLAGVTAKDVQTSDLQINPQYNAKGLISGYEVTNTLVAKLRNFTTAGTVIDSIAGAAGNAIRLDSLAFSVEDTRGLEDQARTDAVHQAVAHAQSMAQAANEALGPVCSLTDQTQTTEYGGTFNDQSAASSAVAGAPTVPLEPGSQQETAQVTMVYALKAPPASTAPRTRH